MSGKTKIEWTEKVWNPVTGCTKVSAGCKNCYAETIAKRFWGNRKFSDIEFHEERLSQPESWKKPSFVFVNSMSDLFHEKIEYKTIEKIFDVMIEAENHFFQVLTKRPERMRWFIEKYCRENIEGDFYSKEGYRNGCKDFLKNIWFGVTVENQSAVNERIPILLDIPVNIKFLSCEPLLEEIELSRLTYSIEDNKHLIDWVIVGGESGVKARPMNPDWVKKIRDNCLIDGIPFFFKQWGTWGPDGIKRNKKENGRLIDDIQCDGMPYMRIMQ